MKKVRRILVILLCFCLISTCSAFAAETEDSLCIAGTDESGDVFRAGTEEIPDAQETEGIPQSREDTDNEVRPNGSDESGPGFEKDENGSHDEAIGGSDEEEWSYSPDGTQDGTVSENGQDSGAQDGTASEEGQNPGSGISDTQNGEALDGEDEPIPEDTGSEDGADTDPDKGRQGDALPGNEESNQPAPGGQEGSLPAEDREIILPEKEGDVIAAPGEDTAGKDIIGTQTSKDEKKDDVISETEKDVIDPATEEEKIKKADAEAEIASKSTSPSLSITRKGSNYIIKLKNISNVSKVSRVQFAVWSSNKGQDDIQWYEASANKSTKEASIKSDLSKHSDTGEFNVHAYILYTSGKQDFAAAKTFNRIKQGQASLYSFKVKLDRPAGKFTLTAEKPKSPSGVKTVQAAVWCKSRAKDLVWYTMKATGSDTYKVTGNIKKHGYARGTYYVEVYAVSASGKKVLLQSDSFKMVTGCSEIRVSTKDHETYTASVDKLTVPGGIKQVQFAVWSETGGQDDLVWYTPEGKNGGSFKANIKVKNHKHFGTYQLHIYVTTAGGSRILMRSTTFSVLPKVNKEVRTSGVKDGDGKFTETVTVKSSRNAISSMKFEVWCKEDKSDVYWYRVPADSSGQFKAVINTANHYGHRGTYSINIIAVFENGLEGTLATDSVNFKPASYLSVPESNGTCIRRVTYINKNVSSVTFKVWTTRGGSGDSKTYKGKKLSDGKFYADVNMDHFKYDGKYRVEVYSGSKRLDACSFIMLDYLEEGYKMALDDNIGYSQIHRCLNPDVDCSSFVHYSLLNTGYNVNNTGSTWPITTYDEEARLKGAGFSMYAYTNISDLQPGDILLRDGHTEIYAGHGTTVGAHGDENDDIYGYKTGDQTGIEVCVARLAENWQYVFRYLTYQT